jgi:hypothetical protein
VLGLVVIVIIIAVAASGGGGGSGGGSAAPASGSSSPAAKSSPTAKAARLGSPVRDGKFAFTVTSVSHAKTVGDTQYGMGDTAQGEFTILHLAVTNIGNQSQTLDDSSQYVYDSSGKKYNASSNADIDLAGSNGQNNTWFQDINPGNTVRGEIAFDMPSGAKAVKAELHDSAFSGGVTVSLH